MIFLLEWSFVIIFQNGETAIETLLDCQNLNHNIPRLRWSEPLLCLITKLNDSAIEFISCNFIAVLQSTAFHKLDKVGSVNNFCIVKPAVVFPSLQL